MFSKTISVLLVNNNADELHIFRRILERAKIKASIFSVSSAQAALDLLMGSSQIAEGQHYKSKHLRPDVILLNKDLPDMAGIEFLTIIRKYHSLGNIKVFLLYNAAEQAPAAPVDLAVTGCLQRPFEENPDTFENFGLLRSELKNEHALLSAIYLASPNKFKDRSGLLKKSTVKKYAGSLLKYPLGVKITTIVLVALIITGAGIYTKTNSAAEQSRPGIVDIPFTEPEIEQEDVPQYKIEPVKHVAKIPAAKAPVTIRAKAPAPPVTDSITPVVDQMPELLKDKKSYKIRVIEERDSLNKQL
jgi:CheY-like chemotaxis protein